MTFETFDQSDWETWPDLFAHFLMHRVHQTAHISKLMPALSPARHPPWQGTPSQSPLTRQHIPMHRVVTAHPDACMPLLSIAMSLPLPLLSFLKWGQKLNVFTGPRCLWGPVYGSRCLYVTPSDSFVKLCWCWWWYQLNTIHDANLKRSLAIRNQCHICKSH